MREPTELPIGEEPSFKFEATVDGPTHHYQGWIRVRIYGTGIYVQWVGEADWYEVTWWEFAHFAHATPPKLREELEWERDDARAQGLREAIADFKKNPDLWLTEKKPPVRS